MMDAHALMHHHLSGGVYNMSNLKTKRRILQVSSITIISLLFLGIKTGEKYAEVVIPTLVITMLLYQITICTVYCPFCKGQLFGFFIQTNTTGAESFKFLLGIKKIKCYNCEKEIDMK
jgi:hypothetical protein